MLSGAALKSLCSYLLIWYVLRNCNQAGLSFLHRAFNFARTPTARIVMLLNILQIAASAALSLATYFLYSGYCHRSKFRALQKQGTVSI